MVIADKLTEVTSRDPIHNQHRPSIWEKVEIMYRDDVWRASAGQQSTLALESLDLSAGHAELDSHLLIEQAMSRSVDDTHTATA
jgi:hypothetical protein